MAANKWRAYLAVVAVGLDVDSEAFARNVAALRERNAYFGRVNLRSGELSDEWSGESVLPLSALDEARDAYLSLAQRVLVLSEADLADASKTRSHTATVAFRAVSGHFGKHRTFVEWEPVDADGERGVDVSDDHAWLYLFDAVQVEQLKIDWANERKANCDCDEK